MFRCTPLSLTLSLGSYPVQFHRKNFHKSHQFDFVNQVPLLAEANRPGIGGDVLYDVQSESSLHPKSSKATKMPAWVVYDKQMLRFFGYFKETLPESKTPYQVRKIKLVYFLEDDTIQVVEERNDSSTSKGCLVSRQRIRKPKPFHYEHVSLTDLNVNRFICLLDRVYHLTECDAFTRNFLQRLGIAVPNSVDSPLDPTTELRRKEKESMIPKHPLPKDFRFAQFLENDRKVLRFSGYWDDTKSENGDIRVLDVLYHLADDTFEIKERLPLNSGRQSNGMFLRRGKLPRHACNIREVGEGNFAVLNVLGRDVMKGRFLRDRLDIGSDNDNSKYYNERDLAIGRVINVFGREVILTDCDGKTKEFYRKKFGVEDFENIPIPSQSRSFSSHVPEKKLMPPYNGWGSYEDSEGNCMGIEPKAPKIDFRKFMCYDKIILRFGAKMISTIRENNERVFNISYHLADDTISVYELPCRNHGFVAGEFFGKSKFYVPGQEKFTSERPVAYKSQDFYLGATVNLRDSCFKIISADIFALKFMEENKDQYPMSHVPIILTKVRETLRPIYKDFISCYMTKVKTFQTNDGSTEFICYGDFRNFLKDLLGEAIVEHEIVTLCRHFSIETKESPKSHRDAVRSIVQGEILRELWDDIERMREFIYHLSPENVDYLDQDKMQQVIRGCRVPLDKMIVEQMFEVLNRNNVGEFEVQDFINFVDVKNCKASPVPPINPKKYQFNIETDEGSLIEWKAFISSVDLEDELRTNGN